MPKLVFPSGTVTALRQSLNTVRHRLQEIADIATKRGVLSAAAATELFPQVQVLAKYLGGAAIKSGTNVVMPVPTGTRVTGYTVTVNAAGVITALVGY